MQLCRPTAQNLGPVQVRADQRMLTRWRQVRGGKRLRRRRDSQLLRRGVRDDLFQDAAQRIQYVAPPVAFVGDELLRDRDRRGLVSVEAVVDRSAESRSVRE